MISPSENIFRDDFVSGGRTNWIIGERGWGLTQAGSGNVLERTSNGVFPNNTAYRFTSGATTNNYILVSTANGCFVGDFATVSDFDATIIFAPVQTTNCVLAAGFSRNPTSDFQDRGFGIRYIAGTDTNYKFFSKNSVASFTTGTGITLEDSGVAPVIGKFVKLDISVIAAGTIRFRINGGAWVSISSNIPSSGSLTGIFFAEARNSTAAAIDADFFSWRIPTSR